MLLIVLMGIAVPLGSLRLRGWRSLLDAVALAIAFTIATQIAFNSGAIVTFVYPLLALAIGTLGTLAVLYVGEAIERERVRDVFTRFVPAGVVDEVLASTNENLRLGGVERDCTVMFSDLRGFTSFSETQPAGFVIEVVNHYLNEMSEAILAAGGTLIAYMGDGIMAVFGAPLAAGRPRRPRRRRGQRDGRPAPGALQRLDRRAGLRSHLRDGRRPQQRAGDGGQRRVRTARGVHRDRRHDQHSVATGGR